MKRRMLMILTACILVMSVCMNPVMAADAVDDTEDTEETSTTEEQSADEIAAGRFFDAVRAIVLAKAGEGKSKTKAATAILESLTGNQLLLVYAGTDVPLYGSGYSAPDDTDASGSSSGGSSGSSEDTGTGTESSAGDGEDAGTTINVMETYNEALAAYKEDRKFRSGDAWYIVLASVPRQVIKNGFLFKVVEISPYAFRDCRRLETVVIHRAVKRIGRYAFKNTQQLRTIKILAKFLRKGFVKNAFAGAGSGGGSYTGSNLVVKVPKERLEYYNTLFKKEGALNKKATLRKA